MSYWKLIVPEATTNLCTNPSFETNTTGWAATSSNTIARSAVTRWAGAYSLLCTYQDSTTLASYAITLPTASVAYTLTAWVYLPNNWDGGAVSFAGTSFTSATESDVSTAATTGMWTKIETLLTADSDVAGTITIVCAGTPTAGRYIYVDAVQFEQKAYDTTYCDGDQEGCEWVGAKRGSKSTRQAYVRAGGRLYDLADDFYLTNTFAHGAGAPDIQHVAEPYGVIPGDHYQAARIGGRTWGLNGNIIATTRAQSHQRRSALLNALSPMRVYPQQHVRLLYDQGIGEPVYTDCEYLSGLELHQETSFTESVQVMFYSPDPFWRAVREDAAVLDEVDDLDCHYFTSYVNRAWVDSQPSSGGEVYAILKAADGYVYVGGSFTNWNGIAEADYVVRLDPSSNTWSACDTGFNGAVWTLAEAADGTIWAGGAFTATGAAATIRRIAYWNGSAWAEPDSGFNDGYVARIKIAPDGTVYAVGTFTRNGDDDTDIRGLASVTATAIAEVGDGLDAGVTALGIGPDGAVYIGGASVTATNEGSPTAIHGIGKYVPSDDAWTDLCAATPNHMGDLYVDSDGTLYSGHALTAFGLAGYIYSGVGTSWNLWGEGLYKDAANATYIYNIVKRGNGELMVSGAFYYRGIDTGEPLDFYEPLARWNGYSWLPVAVDVTTTSALMRGLYCEGENFYIGHERASAGTIAGDTTVTNSGTSNAYPVVTLKSGTKAGYMFQLFNTTTDQELVFDYTIQSGETVTVDFGAKTIRSDRRGYNIGDNPLPGTTFANWHLAPGANVIHLFITKVVGGSVTALMRWHPAYLGIDGAVS